MAGLGRSSRNKVSRLWVTAQVAAGGIWAALAWWLTDLLIQERLERFQLGLAGSTGGILILLGLMSIGLVSFGVVISSRAAGLAGGAVLIAALILGGYGSGRALGLSPGGDVGLTLLRGAHEPAIYVLLGAWIGGVAWNLVWALRSGTRSASASGAAGHISPPDQGRP